ncbi:hypothetical protein SteCoe_13696 [Stentor coeruleus]|uniref:Casein kinase I n=1 Tax=Stentor coeruleus TaxID=5963 RepID=A0A1R2C7Q6_9CILI|nr:hypothetical protein SteCoe_13696 [Stentor coeruleus]
MDQSSISRRFSLKKIIGQGNFGMIYKALDTETNQQVAIKLIKNRNGIHELQNEVKMLTRLQGGDGIPQLIWSDRTSNHYVMELLGPCVNDKFIKLNRVMTASNFILISEQVLERLEFIHNKSIIHRDLKPHQLVMGGPKHKKVYLIDFGLSKIFESQGGKHIPYSEGRAFVGTFNYASLNAHIGIQQSRRDDLESFCYILAYFLTGDLPWRTSLVTQNEATIKKMKLSIKPHELFGNEVSLGRIFNYTRSLKFDQKPDYIYIKTLLDEHKKTISNLNNRISWKLKRNSSMRNKDKNTKIRKKRNKSVIEKIIIELDENDMSVTQVNNEYPEFKTRQRSLRKKMISEAPTIDSLKITQDTSCLLV